MSTHQGETPQPYVHTALSVESLTRRAELLSVEVHAHLAKLQGITEPRPVRPSGDPEEEQALYAVQCCICQELSPFDADPEAGASWTLGHLAAAHRHFTYQLLRATPVRERPRGPAPWHARL